MHTYLKTKTWENACCQLTRQKGITHPSGVSTRNCSPRVHSMLFRMLIPRGLMHLLGGKAVIFLTFLFLVAPFCLVCWTTLSPQVKQKWTLPTARVGLMLQAMRARASARQGANTQIHCNKQATVNLYGLPDNMLIDIARSLMMPQNIYGYHYNQKTVHNKRKVWLGD